MTGWPDRPKSRPILQATSSASTSVRPSPCRRPHVRPLAVYLVAGVHGSFPVTRYRSTGHRSAVCCRVGKHAEIDP